MSWSPLLPRSRAPVRVLRPAVAASVSAGAGRLAARLTLSLRPERLEGITWLKPGAGLQVLVGFGEHAGMLRITPNGLHILAAVALAKPAGSVLALRLPLPDGLIAAKRPAAPIEHDFNDGWIEVVLPAEWRLPRSAAAGVNGKPPEAAKPAAAGNATSPLRGAQLAAAAAEMARKKAGL
jgi:hypothetical protein